MKNMLIVSALLLLISGPALAGSGYDNCIKAEMELKSQEASQCRGLKYLLNPSACFSTQKILKEYKAGKCRQIGMAENVDFSAQPVVPGKKSSGISSPVSNAGNVGNVSIVTGKKAEPEAAQQEATIEQLKEENARLKAEVSRLTAELEQYTKACR